MLARANGPAVPPGFRAAFIGCGTSFYIAQAATALREASGQGEADPFTPGEAPLSRDYGVVVAISRSGTTTEVARALEQVRSSVLTVAIVGSGGTEVARSARRSVVLDFADERAVVQTRFATTVLAFFRSAFGDDVEADALDAERALADPLPFDLSLFEHFVFLGAGWRFGLANEAALKLREAAQAWTESYTPWEYRHGPIAVAGPRSVVWTFDSPPEGLSEEIVRTGATLVRLPLRPMAQLVLAQRVAVELAGLRGLDPHHPRHLTRSVVL